MADSYGIEVERRRREIAAHHGVPDFVFRPLDVPKGQGQQREVGDFLLWVGDVVAIVSSKSRAPEAASQETQDRRRRWLDNAVEEAYGQIRGVGRTLMSVPAGHIVLESERGVRVPWDPAMVTAYVGVVVVDVPPTDDDYGPPVMTDGIPTVAMLGKDWDSLNEVLPSTMAMIRYLGRRMDYIPRCPMGSELDILALVIESEATGEPIAIPEGGLPKGYFRQVAGEHPCWFLGGHPDDRYAAIVGAMIEGAADPDPEFSIADDPIAYMRIVEFLDRIPLLERVHLGKAVIERCERVGREGGRVTSHFAFPHGLLIFVTDETEREERAAWLGAVTFARHSQALDAGAPNSLVSLGVATQPIPTGNGRSHDFFLVQGNIRSDPEFRESRDERFGVRDMTQLIERLERRES